jgi:hypothetical protein
MGMRQVVAGIALLVGLAGCATDPGNGLRYSDGSYYSPGEEGGGDYYVGRDYDNRRYGDPFFDDFGWLSVGGPWYGGWYGSPFYGYGGYCSVRYRYCPRGGWIDPFPRYDFQIYFGDPWRGGYGGYDHWRPPVRRPSRPPTTRPGEVTNPTEPRPRERAPDRSPETREERPWREPATHDERSDRDDRTSAPRERRGGTTRRDAAPRPVKKDGM